MVDIKIAPHSIELEQAVLAGCFTSQDDAIEACILLTPEDFYRGQNRVIFTHIKNLVETNSPVEIGSVTEQIITAGQLTEVGGATYLSSLLDLLGPSGVVYYCQKLRDYAARRGMLEICNAGVKRAYDGKIEDAIEYMQREVDKLDPSLDKSTSIKFLDQLVTDAQIRYERIAAGEVHGVPTGYASLDRKLWALQPADLIILAARPSMGKTALALNIARHTSSEGSKVAFFSLEQSSSQLTDRAIASKTGINLNKFRDCNFTQPEHNLLAKAQSSLYNQRLAIDDRAGLSVHDIKATARRMFRDSGLDLIVVDYLQLVKSRKSGENRNLEIGEVCRELKGLAKELNIPVLANSQLNRDLERRPNPKKRPMMADLRDSGEIEQVADVVLFIYRGEVYNDTEMPENTADIIVGKQRQGELGTVRMIWDGSTVTFKEIALHEEPEYHAKGSKR